MQSDEDLKHPLHRMLELAAEVFGEKACEWVTSPLPELGGKTPYQTCLDGECERVISYLIERHPTP